VKENAAENKRTGVEKVWKTSAQKVAVRFGTCVSGAIRRRRRRLFLMMAAFWVVAPYSLVEVY
jgi:hypothetical protein